MTNILILGAGFGGIRTALDLSRLLRNRVPTSSRILDRIGRSSISLKSGEKKFRKNNGVKITVLDRRNFHLFTPSLYEVATVYGLVEDSFAQYLRGSVAIPMAEIFENKKINFVQAEIEEVNLKEKFVKTGGGAKLNFDYLVIALGGVTEFFGIPGIADYAFDFKDIDNAVGIYKKIREVYEKFRQPRSRRTEDRRNWGRQGAERPSEGGGAPSEKIRIAVVGGGFTGVELAAELSCCVENIIEACKLDKQYTQISLFEAGEKILPAVEEKQRKVIEKRLKNLGVQIMVNSPVVEADPDYIKVKKPSFAKASEGRDEPFKTDLVIWAGGIRGPRLLENLGLKLSKKGFIEANEYLQAINPDGTVDENIFIVGDSGGYIDPKTERPVPATAYIAYRQGAFVAENIARALKNEKFRPYKPFYDIWVAPVGGKWAYFHYGVINIKGFWGYLMKQLVDLKYFSTILPFNRALALFFKDLVIFSKND